MNIYMKNYAFIIVFFLFFKFSCFGMDCADNPIDYNDITVVKNVASNILNIKRDYTTQMEHGIDTIINDHSLSHHSSGDSHFTTDDRDKIRTLINLVVSQPDLHEFYTRGSKNRITVRKTISKSDSLSIFNTEHIGWDERYQQHRDHVVLCFDVTGINTISDSIKNGAFLTGFSARHNYKSG